MNVRLNNNVFDTDKISAITHSPHYMGRDEAWIIIGFQGGAEQRYPLSDPEAADFYEWYQEQAQQPWRSVFPNGFIAHGETVIEAVQRHLQDAGIFDTRVDYYNYDIVTNSTRFLLSYGDGTNEEAIRKALPRRVLHNIDFAYIGKPENDNPSAVDAATGEPHFCENEGCEKPAAFTSDDVHWFCGDHWIPF